MRIHCTLHGPMLGVVQFNHVFSPYCDVHSCKLVKKIILSFQPNFSASRLNSCGTNIYGRKKRDLRSLLRALIQERKEQKEEKEEQTEELKTEKKEEKEEKVEERILGGTPSRKGK